MMCFTSTASTANSTTESRFDVGAVHEVPDIAMNEYLAGCSPG